MNLRIGLAGAAGTGKSTLARMISEKLGLPLLASKAVTQEILDKDGYDYGSGIHIERFLANSDRQVKLVNLTFQAQGSHPNFVTDRTAIDLAAYALCELHNSDPTTLKRLFDKCRSSVGLYTHIFLCPWLDKPVSDNRRRTLNPWYQLLIHIIEEGIASEWGVKLIPLKEVEAEARLKEVVGILMAGGMPGQG
jgi:predicted ATPase